MRDGWLSIYPPLGPSGWRMGPGPPAFPLGEPGSRLYSRARQGLFDALRCNGLAGSEVLVPALHHGSEVETLERAGLICRFYGRAGAVRPDEEELSALVGPRTRALYLIHVLGVPQDSRRWRDFCDARGLSLIEDGAQAWLGKRDGVPVGALADIAIFCMHKVQALPDGAALFTGRGATTPPRPEARAKPGAGRFGRLFRDYLSQRAPAPALARLRRSARFAHLECERPEEHFAASPIPYAPSRLSQALAVRTNGPRVAAARMRHYAFLRGQLEEHVSESFDMPVPGASPLAFPLETADKPGLLAHLARSGIIDGQLWTVPHPSLPQHEFPLSISLRKRMIGLPVHQELAPSDLDRIVQATREWFRHGGR